MLATSREPSAVTQPVGGVPHGADFRSGDFETVARVADHVFFILAKSIAPPPFFGKARNRPRAYPLRRFRQNNNFTSAKKTGHGIHSEISSRQLV